jgi:hypothetical protein
MATVRQTVQALAAGKINLRQAAQTLAGRADWDPPMPEPTEAQLYGLEDIAPPGDNSPDQINMVPGLEPDERAALWAAVRHG